MTGVWVLEGPDAAGKSTAAERLLSDLADAGVEAVYVHNDASDAQLPGSLYRHYRAQLLDAADRWERDGVATVIDRSFLSEVVYGRVYRRPRVSERQAHRLERLAAKRGIELLGYVERLVTRRRRMLARGETFTAQDAFVGAEYSVWFRARARYWRLRPLAA